MKYRIAFFIALISLTSPSFLSAENGPSGDFIGRTLDLVFHDLLSGEEIRTITGDEGRVGTLVVFWSISCGPCLREIPDLNSLYADWKHRGLEIIGLPQDERPEQVLNLCQSFGITWPQLVESGRPFEKPTAAQWHITRTPSFILLDSSGVVLDYGFENPARTVRRNF